MVKNGGQKIPDIPCMHSIWVRKQRQQWNERLGRLTVCLTPDTLHRYRGGHAEEEN